MASLTAFPFLIRLLAWLMRKYSGLRISARHLTGFLNGVIAKSGGLYEAIYTVLLSVNLGRGLWWAVSGLSYVMLCIDLDKNEDMIIKSVMA